MAWMSTILLVITLAFLLQVWLWSPSKSRKKKLPPGPIGFPILGSLHLLGKLPHRDLYKLSKKYGPIMSMRLGLVPTIVVSSPEAAELFLKTHDLVFASRPLREASKHMGYGQKTLVFSSYGTYWRDMRKMCTLELLSTSKINSFKFMRKEELDLFVNDIKLEAAASLYRRRLPVDVRAKLGSLGAVMSSRMVLGKKYTNEEFNERGFKAVIEDVMHLAAIPNIADYIPQLARFDLQGLTKKMKAISKVFDDFFDKIIDGHMQSRKDDIRTKDFVDVMLSFMPEESAYRIGRKDIKAILLDMLVTSMDTSTTAVEWVLSELLKHPRIMKKLQNELEEKIGLDKMVEESDLEGLEYLDMVIKETFRLHPVAPVLIPHESMEDITINGYFIPKKSQIIINTWAIGRDPSLWEDADKFLPERFLKDNVDVRGRDFRLLPFGSGRRSCPGIQLGLLLVKLLVAQLVHCFDWELPDNMLPSELDMNEELGLVCPRSNHLFAIPTYRLHI